MDLLERIEMNIRIEAQQYIEKRIPLPFRSNTSPAFARRDVYVKKFLAEYIAKNGVWSSIQIPWTSTQRESIKANVVSQLTRMAEQFNMFPEESNAWLDWAESLYEITPTFEVRSHAKVRGKNKAWQLLSDVDVEAKIGELIAYKIHDRIYKYGHPVEDMNGTRPLILPY